MPFDSSSFGTDDVPNLFEEAQRLVTHGATSDSYKVRLYGKWHFLKCPKAAYRDNPLYIAAFEREFELGFHLDHPHIVRYLSKGTDDRGRLYILTEYVDGKTLTEFLRDNPDFPADKKELKRILLQICDALSYLHDRQIVHYDLKPDNILITRNGHNVKLIDLGFSYSDSYPAIACGTKPFASPEQLSAPQTSDLRSDVYAFGKILEFLFQGFPLSRKYRSLIVKATREDAASRFQSINELSAQIDKKRSLWWVWVMAIVCTVAGSLLFLRRHPETATETTSADSIMMVRMDTTLQIIEREVVQPPQPSAEEITLKRFRNKLSAEHKVAFKPYYDSIRSILTQAEYETAMVLCEQSFGRAKAVEDSLLRVYLNLRPDLERDFRHIAEEEMAASMSKHAAMQRRYIRELNQDQ